MSEIGFMYLAIEYRGQFAVIQVTDESFKTWRLMNPEGVGWWVKDPAWHWGEWRDEYGAETYKECQQSTTKGVVFKLKDLDFSSIDIDNSHQFAIGNDWVKGSPLLNTVGTWRPVMTDLLLSAKLRELEELQQQLIYQMGQLGIAGAAMFDPTGIFSLAGAGWAMREGDYVGCAANLLGVIPVLGKIATASRLGRISAQLENIAARLASFQKSLKFSANAAKRAGLTGKIVRAEIQGTKIVRSAVQITEGVELASVSQRGGMAMRDAEGLQNCAMRNDAVMIVRSTASESLKVQEMRLVEGKPLELSSFHTAKEGEFEGYIVISKEQMATETFKNPSSGYTQLKNFPEYRVEQGADKFGNRLITKENVAFYSDYDFQGMYHAKNGKPYLDFKVRNDDAGIIKWLNEIVPSNFGTKVKHGMQDFWRRKVFLQNGQKRVIPGRVPSANETFLVFEPSGKVSHLNLKQLYFLYQRYKIPWIYKVPL